MDNISHHPDSLLNVSLTSKDPQTLRTFLFGKQATQKRFRDMNYTAKSNSLVW